MYLDTAQTRETTHSKSKTREIVAATIGTFFEWYDLLLYASFAVVLSKLFFPMQDPSVSMVLTLLTFASSYLIRPLGAIVIGGYADRAGRRAALVLSSILMAIGTFMTAVLPTYSQIGIAAPVMLVIARLIQGFSAGGEFGSANTYLTEQNSTKRAFFASFQFASTGAAIVAASLFAYVLNNHLDRVALEGWGWRIPFLIGLLIAPVAYYIRRNVEESPEFEAVSPSRNPLSETLRSDKWRLIVGAGIVCSGNVASYVNIYMPTYAITQLHLPATSAFIGGIGGGMVSAIFPLLGGHLADRFGAIRVMAIALTVGACGIYPAFLWLTAHPSVGALVLVQAAMSLVFYSFYYAPAGSVLSQLFPVSRRTTGVSISYVASQTLFGGITPLIVNLLISKTENPMMPAAYLCAIALISGFALLAAKRLKID